MADQTENSQKTEEPTHKKLEDARKKGQVAHSREVNHWFMILGLTILMLAFAPQMMGDLREAMIGFIAAPHAISADGPGFSQTLQEAGWKVLLALLVPMLLLMATALVAGFLQSGYVLAVERIHPKLEKISLLKGVKRLFSLKAIMEFTKGILKLAIVSTVCTILILPEFSHLEHLTGLPLPQALATLDSLAIRILIGVLSIISIIAGIDYLYQRYDFQKQMRMTRQEVKDELKQTEGDPIIRSRLRQLRMERAQRRMMAAVPEADVVGPNPTHYAVALKYDMETMEAPRLVAKGMDSLAARIREVAKENDVPVVENPPLAQALYAGVEIDQEISSEHYKAAAEVIAFVMRLKGKLLPGRAPGVGHPGPVYGKN
ncbi:MAG: flagellar biosynthesis protein FlhB [Alphaproteobacteria bacterium]|nr:flagellar biosynthesis protein FlhB [Alphaproteobacteria bacterium]